MPTANTEQCEEKWAGTLFSFFLPDVFFFTPGFVPGRFSRTVLVVGFFAAVLRAGAFFNAACFAGALGRGGGLAAVISGAVRKSTAAL